MTSEALAIPVMKMARDHARHVSRLPVLQRVVAWFLGRTTRLAQRLLIAQVRRMQDNAVWFAGATTKIDQMEPSDSVVVDDALFDELRAVEAQLMQLRSNMMGVRERLQNVKAAPPVLAENHNSLGLAVQMSIEAAAELYECVRDFRGAAQAYAANCCAAYQAHRPRMTAETLEADFREITG
jgi:acetone carboxylase gamma subunit